MRVLAVTGPFVPTNEPMTLLPYKQLRQLPAEIDVVALRHQIDDSLQLSLNSDPMFQKFKINYVGNYDDVLFSIRNINLIGALMSMRKYVSLAVKQYFENKYDVLYTSSFPAYTHLVGSEIKKQNKQLKWIANFTDPINHSPYKFDEKTYQSYMFLEKLAFKAYNHFYVNDYYEKIAFENADLLVFICEEQRNYMIQQYLKYYGKLTEQELLEKCVIVPLNYIGEWSEYKFDEELKNKSDKIEIAHFGRIYGLRLIEEFIYAIRDLLEEDPTWCGKFVIRQFGEFRKSDLNLIKKLNLSHYFEINEKIEYKKCLNEMKHSDVVLVFDTILSTNQWQPYLPSKIMEYSILHKNVLAITTTKSPTYRIMQESKALCAPYDRVLIKQELIKALNGYSSKIDYSIENKEATEMFLNKFMELHNS